MALAKKPLLVFCNLFLGYLMIAYIRQSVSYASPLLAETEHIGSNHLGLILSSQMLGYTLVQVVGGTLVDFLDPGMIFTICLILTGITAASFAAVSSVPWFMIMWFLNGTAQGPAWPACAVLLKQNFPVDQFATWWSVLSVSSNVAGTLGPFISQVLFSVYGWRTAELAVATLCLSLGVISYFALSTSPSQYQKDSTKKTGGVAGKDVHIKELFSPLLIIVCLNYLLTGVVRTACMNWGLLYLIQNKEQPLLTGTAFISSQEVGGIVGSVLAGYISDYMITNSSSRAKPRLQLTAFLSVVQSVGLYLFTFHVTMHSTKMWVTFLGFVIGFGMYGIISLLGVTSMEVSPEGLSGTGHSMSSLGGNIGKVLAGYPLSLMATATHSWHQSFCCLILVSFLSVICSIMCLKVLSKKEAVRDKQE